MKHDCQQNFDCNTNLGVSFVSGSKQRRCVTCGGWVCRPMCVARCGKWPLATSSTSHMVTFQLYSLLSANCFELLLFVVRVACDWGEVVFIYCSVVQVACDWGNLYSFILLISELFVTVGSCVRLFFCCQSCL